MNYQTVLENIKKRRFRSKIRGGHRCPGEKLDQILEAGLVGAQRQQQPTVALLRYHQGQSHRAYQTARARPFWPTPKTRTAQSAARTRRIMSSSTRPASSSPATTAGKWSPVDTALASQNIMLMAPSAWFGHLFCRHAHALFAKRAGQTAACLPARSERHRCFPFHHAGYSGRPDAGKGAQARLCFVRITAGRGAGAREKPRHNRHICARLHALTLQGFFAILQWHSKWRDVRVVYGAGLENQ